MMNRRSFPALLAIATLGSAPLAAQDSTLAPPGTFVLRAAHLIDGTGSAEVQNAAIVVVGDSKAVGEQLKAFGDFTVTDK